jgi:hypothetical protein
MAKLSATLCGVAGEYFVAAELSRRGYIASITLRNTRGIDILASSEDGSRQIGIQVKSSQTNRPAWPLNEKAEDYFANNLFYIFVNLKDENERLDYYIVPSQIVADFTKANHQRWLNTPGKHGQQHNATPMRTFADNEKKYLEKWSLLGF